VTGALPRTFGAYELLKALGRGGMGSVHLARPIDPERHLPTPLVIKTLHAGLSEREEFVSRFRHEAQIAVAIDSPHVAKVFDVGAVEDELYIAMEYIAGWRLSQLLEALVGARRAAPIEMALELIDGALVGLSALHEARDVHGERLEAMHRDLSPKNLMLGEDARMRLIDLGLGGSNAQAWRTATGIVMGTPGYMSPEQIRGERADQRSDLYQMGVVLFETLCLRRYIERGPLSEVMRVSLDPPWTPPSSLRPEIPAELEAVVEKALDLEPEHRFQTADEFRAAIRPFLAPRSQKAAIVTLVRQLFGAEVAGMHAEIQRLLDAPLPARSPSAVATHSVVFALRDSAVPVTEEDLAPTRLRSGASRAPEEAVATHPELAAPTVPGVAATAVRSDSGDPPASVSRPATRAAEGPSRGEVRPFAPVTPAVPWAVAPPPRSTAVNVLIGLVIVLAVAVGALLDRVMVLSKASPAAAPPVNPQPRPELPRAVPGQSGPIAPVAPVEDRQEARVSPPAPPPPSPPRTPPSQRPRDKSHGPPLAQREPPREDVPAAAESSSEAIRRITVLGDNMKRDFKKNLRGEALTKKQGEVDTLITAASMASAKGDPVELAKIEQSLRALAVP
jgi:serine/threonine-protein kinase